MNSDLTVQNKMEMLDWAEKSSKCTSDAAVWIKQETAGPEGIAGLDPARLGSWTVYNFVSKVMPTGLVPGDDPASPYCLGLASKALLKSTLT